MGPTKASRRCSRTISRARCGISIVSARRVVMPSARTRPRIARSPSPRRAVSGWPLSRFLLDRTNLELQMGRPDEAAAHAARALALNQTAAGPGATSSDIGSASLALGRALLGQGKRTEAHAALSLAVEHLTLTLGADHPSTRLATRLSSAFPVLLAVIAVIVVVDVAPGPDHAPVRKLVRSLEGGQPSQL